MIRINRFILYLILVLIVVLTSFLLFTVFSKHSHPPPIALIMYNRDAAANSIDSLSNEKFWDNYPYLVLLSRNKKINREYIFKQDNENIISVEELLKEGKNIFFRYQFDSSNDSFTRDILRTLVIQNTHINIITDIKSYRHLVSDLRLMKIAVPIYTFNYNLPIIIEKVKKSYFFQLNTKFLTNDIFVPRSEIPEVLTKYLDYLATYNKN